MPIRRPARITPRPTRLAGDAYRRAAAEELIKALALPRGATTQTPQQITAGYLASLAQRNGASPEFVNLPRDPANLLPFGPGEPLYPAPIAPLLPSGRQPPQRHDYEPSWNLQTTSNRLVPWTVLRDASQQVSIVRACIDACVSAITGLDWSFGIDSARARALAKRSNTSSHEVISDLQDKYADDIDRLHQWWMKPDRINHLTFVQWLTMLLEDELTLDAVSLYPHFAFGGKLHSIEIVDSSCYSADTEVLTKRGWLPFSQVDTATDWFATRNQKTKEFEWQQATYYHQAPFSGELLNFRSKSLDVLVTPNHRMLIEGLPRSLGGSRHRTEGESIVSAEELAALGRGYGSRRIPMTSHWEGADLDKFELPGNGHTTSKPFTCSGDDFAAFMGMYLAEGCFTNGDQVCITQFPKSKGFEPFRELLERILGRKVCHTGASFVIGRKVLHDYLAQFGKSHEKYVPEIVKNMSGRQLSIFWHFYMLGDGYRGRQGEMIFTVSSRMAGDLQEVAQKLGLSATVSSHQSVTDTIMLDGRVIKAENKRRNYTVRLSHTTYRTWSVSTVPYDGEVFCVSVPNEILYVRRNGKPAWCGNTIKPLLDDRGATPQLPHPAYQQIRYGFPRGEYTQTSTPPELIDHEFTSVIYGKPQKTSWAPTDQLMYKVRNCRSFSPYGFSNVEQALADIDLWLKRVDWLRSEYSAGVTPEMLVNVDMTMSPEQLRQYEAVFNDDLSGRTSERHRARFLPAGFTPMFPAGMDSKFNSDFDLHLVRLICASFDVLPTSLGFTPNHNGGLAGQSAQEGEQDCYSKDTEVLTREGWKRFEDVDISVDEFATRNPKTHAFEWQVATHKTVADFDGEMIRFHNSRTLDVLVSPNHRMLVSNSGRGPEFILRAHEATEHSYCRIPALSEWDASDLERFELPASGRTNSKPFECSGDDFAAFMGMYLAEGCPIPYGVQIAQREQSKGFADFKTLVERLTGREAKHHGERSLRIFSSALRDYCAQFGKANAKFIPDVVKNMSARQLKIFMHYYWLGDGWAGTNGQPRMATVSKRFADDLQEIAQKIGYAAGITIREPRRSDQQVTYSLALRKAKTVSYQTERVQYKDKIYCVSVPNEILYVRRNGQPIWCGNSQLARGTKPRVKWLVGVINEICHNYLSMPPEVTFSFHGIDDEDEQKEATLLEGYVTTGGMVLNEMRDRLNLPRYGIEQANEPFIATPTGPAFFNPKVQPVGMPGNLPSASQNQPGQQGNIEPAVDVSAAEEPRDHRVQGSSKQAEQKAFMSCVRAQAKSERGWRNFTFKAHSPVMAEAANRLASDGNIEACKALFEYDDAA